MTRLALSPTVAAVHPPSLAIPFYPSFSLPPLFPPSSPFTSSPPTTMHRAAVRAFRTTCQTTLRGLSRTSNLSTNAQGAGARAGGAAGIGRGTTSAGTAASARRSFQTSTPRPNANIPKHVLASIPLASNMYIRRFSVALVSSLSATAPGIHTTGPRAATSYGPMLPTQCPLGPFLLSEPTSYTQVL